MFTSSGIIRQNIIILPVKSIFDDKYPSPISEQSWEANSHIIDIPIVDIIKNAVHAFAGEPLSNIILNDIDNYGL